MLTKIKFLNLALEIIDELYSQACSLNNPLSAETADTLLCDLDPLLWRYKKRFKGAQREVLEDVWDTTIGLAANAYHTNKNNLHLDLPHYQKCLHDAMWQPLCILLAEVENEEANNGRNEMPAV